MTNSFATAVIVILLGGLICCVGYTVDKRADEIIALLTVTLLYFVIGAWAFRRRHMKIE